MVSTDEDAIVSYATKIADGGRDAESTIAMLVDYVRSGGDGLVPFRVLYHISDMGLKAAFLENFRDERVDRPLALAELAKAYAWSGRPVEALECLTILDQEHGLDAHQFAFKAVQHARIGEFERAESYLKQAVEHDAGLVEERAISAQFFDFLRRYSFKDASAMMRAANGTFKTPDIAAIEADILAAIESKTPYLLLRLGDGEGSVIKINADDEKRNRDYYRANRKEFLEIWFRDQSVADDPQFDLVIDAFNSSVAAADCIGGLYQNAIDHEYRLGSRRGIAWVVNSLRKVLALAEANPAWSAKTSIYTLVVHYDLLLSGALNRILEGRPRVGLISCHPDLSTALQRRFNIAHVEFFKVPGEQLHAAALGVDAVAGRHWPERFRELTATLGDPNVDRRGQVFLVAAGMLGKIYAHQLKLAGAVVIDIGAVADLWMKKNTRVFPSLPTEVTLDHTPLLSLVDVGGLGGLQQCWVPYLDQIMPVIFEPNPPEAQAIRANLGNRGKVVERALGRVAESKALRVTKSLGCTSMLAPNPSVLAPYSIKAAFNVTHTIQVDCVRYDELFRMGEVPRPDAIKIDVQGFEYDVLSGFGELLDTCLGIQLEAHLYPIYEGQKLLHDLISLLEPHGLTLRKISPVNHFDGDVVEIDAWFTCSISRRKALSSTDVAKLALIEKAWEIEPHRQVFGPHQFD